MDRTGAVVEGPLQAVARAFDVEVHDYRGRRGQVFYARQQPQVPDEVRGEVSELGRILGFTPFHDANRWMRHLEVPRPWPQPRCAEAGLQRDPADRGRLHRQGITVVVFAFDGVDQSDLDLFSDTFAPPVHPRNSWATWHLSAAVRRPWT